MSEARWSQPGRPCIGCKAELPLGRTRSRCHLCSRKLLDEKYSKARPCPRCAGLIEANYKSAYCRLCTSKIASDNYANLKTGFSRYGITSVEYLKMLAEQDDKCAICRGPEFVRKRFCIDHDHKTGKVRGLLCSSCNKALGFFQDSSENLAAAIAYLKGSNDQG